MSRLIVKRQPEIGGGIAITYQGKSPNQAVFWDVVSVDPETGAENVSRGYLKWPITKTDMAGLSVNYYFAPADSVGQNLRYDTGRVYDTGLVYDGNASMVGNDRVKIRVADA